MKKIPKDFFDDTSGDNIYFIPADNESDADFPFRQIPVAAYARVSTQLDKQQSSYALQREYYMEKIMHNPEWTFAGIYADEGISGTQAEKRPGFMKMIRDCRKGKIKMVLTKSLSRFTRNTAECLQYVRELKALGVAVVFEKEGINTLNNNSETMIAMHSVLAQAESESISNSLKWAFRRRFAQGQPHYNFKDWLGYDRGPDGIPVLNELEAKVVRVIFEKYLSGLSIMQITDWLNEENIPKKDGHAPLWRPGNVHSILHNERYCGDALCQKTYSKDYITHKSVKNQGEVRQYYVRDCHPATISRADYLKVQKILEDKRRYYKNVDVTEPLQNRVSNSRYILSGLLVCGECGSPYYRTTGRKGKSWRCSQRMKYASQFCKDSPQVYEVHAHRMVMQTICDEFPELWVVPDPEEPEGLRRLEGLPEFDSLLVRHMLKAIKVVTATNLVFYFRYGKTTEIEDGAI